MKIIAYYSEVGDPKVVNLDNVNWKSRAKDIIISYLQVEMNDPNIDYEELYQTLSVKTALQLYDCSVIIFTDDLDCLTILTCLKEDI